MVGHVVVGAPDGIFHLSLHLLVVTENRADGTSFDVILCFQGCTNRFMSRVCHWAFLSDDAEDLHFGVILALITVQVDLADLGAQVLALLLILSEIMQLGGKHLVVVDGELEHWVVNIGVHALVFVGHTDLLNVEVLHVSNGVVVDVVGNGQFDRAARVVHQIVHQVDALPVRV